VTQAVSIARCYGIGGGSMSPMSQVPTTRRSYWVLCFVLSVTGTGCGKTQGEQNHSSVVRRSSSANPRSPIPTAAGVPVASAIQSPKRETDLLGIVPAKIAVSSAVRNPRDFPEHLVDGDPNTAWNSQTGDLAGAWIMLMPSS
jgi:hypothetical protein